MIGVLRRGKVAGMLAALFLLSGGTIQTKSNSQSVASKPAGCARIEVLDEDATDRSATSPNGKYTVCVKEDRDDRHGRRYTDVYLSRDGYTRRIRSYKEIGGTRALKWAPDSSAFGWNWTSGGAVGPWNTELFDMKSGRFLPMDRRAVRDFLNRMRLACGNGEVDTNQFFLKWVGSDNVLIAIQARQGGEDCRQPHPTDVYQVALPSGRVVKRLQGAEREAISREFGWL
jgi:hypothetical protein